MAIAAILALPAVTPAQTRDQVAMLGCRNATIGQLRREQSADSIRLAMSVSVKPLKAAKFSVMGGGEYRVTGRSEWIAFGYECIYSSQSARATVRVRPDDDKR